LDIRKHIIAEANVKNASKKVKSINFSMFSRLSVSFFKLNAIKPAIYVDGRACVLRGLPLKKIKLEGRQGLRLCRVRSLSGLKGLPYGK